MGIGLRELEDWVCCGASSAHSMNRQVGHGLPALTLESAAEKTGPLAVACAMCFWRLKMTADEISRNGNGNGHKSKPVEVVHLLQVLEKHQDALKITHSLEKLKVACYYGCLLVRPHEIMKLDDDEHPMIMDRLLARTGATTLEWSGKTDCCGASLALARPDMVLQMSHNVLSQAQEAGADCLAVACPMCHSNLDMMQSQIHSKYQTAAELPVFYFTQLLGLAIGLSPAELMLDKHHVSPLPLLAGAGVR